jgi:uncharacterized damage-inducible protein DinB
VQDDTHPARPVSADYDVRPAPGEFAGFYQKYIERVPAGGIAGLLERQIEATLELLRQLSEEEAAHAYAPGKWTIREVVGHVTDAERVFAYRALRIARADPAGLAGFDENAWVPAGGFGHRPLAALAAELAAVRTATVLLLRGLPDAAWERRGSANGQEVTVRALAWIMAGHELHHRAILEERYLPGVREPVRGI